MAPTTTARLSVIDESLELESGLQAQEDIQEFKEKNERSKKILKDIRQLIESVYINL